VNDKLPIRYMSLARNIATTYPFYLTKTYLFKLAPFLTSMTKYGCNDFLEFGRAMAEAVSRWLPTAAARVPAQVRSCGICGGHSGTGAGFLRVNRFPLPILIPLTAPHSSSSIIRGWYNRPISGRRTKWIQSQPTPRN
jgi:hypothetical protein